MSPVIYRGDTWRRSWILQDGAGNPINLTGATARLHLRDKAGTLVVEATQGNGRITITPAAGKIDLVVPAAIMQGLLGEYLYDLEVTYSSGIRVTYESGRLHVKHDITYD